MIIETIDEENVEIMTNFSNEEDNNYEEIDNKDDNHDYTDNNEENYQEIDNKYNDYQETNGRESEEVKNPGILVSDILNEEQTLIDMCSNMWNKRYDKLTEEEKGVVDAIIVSSYGDKEILNNFPSTFEPKTVGWEIRYCKLDDSFERVANPNCILKHNTKPKYSVFVQEKHGIRQVYKIDGLDTVIVAIKNDSKFEPTKGELDYFNKIGVKTFIPIKETRDGNYIRRKDISIEGIKPRMDEEGNWLIKILLLFLVVLLILITVLIAYITLKN